MFEAVSCLGRQVCLMGLMRDVCGWCVWDMTYPPFVRSLPEIYDTEHYANFWAGLQGKKLFAGGIGNGTG